MGDSLYKKLTDINILRRGWHLARSDSRNDWVIDAFRYNDFAFNLEKNLHFISSAIEKGEYHPNPSIIIDVPKSTLTVRPGSVISIEDRVVLFSIIDLIAIRLDKKLPDNVYSYRLKKKKDAKSLFKDLEILKFPFLKKGTIQKRVSLTEPWYGQWPKYTKQTIYTFEKEGFKFLTISDISAYFENINISILRDVILKYLPKEQKIVNLLCSLLEFWTLQTIHGLSIKRGIPQGSEVFNFLGNIYLLPLDEEVIKFSKNKEVKYYRYMDDVKIFSKREDIAREVLSVMNDALRKIHLNIQGSKTVILEGENARDELIDPRMQEANDVIEEIKKSPNMTCGKQQEYNKRLKKVYAKIKNKNKIIQEKDLRLYRRLITGFNLLDSSHMVNNILNQLPMNPDARLIKNAATYLINFPKSSEKIANKLLRFLKSPINLFPYQEAYIISILRRLKTIPKDVIEYSRKCLKLKGKHWYVRAQAALLLSNINLRSSSLDSLKKLYDKEPNIELRRAYIKCLCQQNRDKLESFLQDLLFENHYRLFKLGRMLTSLYYNHDNSAQEEISHLFREFDEINLLESYYKIDVIKNCKKTNIRKNLYKKLKGVRREIKRDHLKVRIKKTLHLLKNGLAN